MVRHPETGKYRRTRLFVLTLAHSRKAVRLLTWQSSAQTWAELHERAFGLARTLAFIAGNVQCCYPTLVSCSRMSPAAFERGIDSRSNYTVHRIGSNSGFIDVRLSCYCIRYEFTS